MRITVTEIRTYVVPELIEFEVRSAIELNDKEYLDGLLYDIETHGGLEGVETIKVVEELS